MRHIVSASLVLVLILTSSCGSSDFATSLRLVIAAGAPILDVLQQQGKISPELRAVLITDLSNEALAVGDMANCFKTIPKGDAQSKLLHLQCVQTLDRSPVTAKLLSDFSGNPNVTNIADDVSSVIQAAIIFYGGTTKAAARVGGGSRPAITQAEINARVKKLKGDLGQK